MPHTLRELFDAVTHLPKDAQRAALETLTDDGALINKVLRLCDHACDYNADMAKVVAANVDVLSASLSNELDAGDRLDSWKLIEKIGQGGMGTVFLAERADGHFQQTVAVKVMHGLPTAAAKARLAQERQILAGLTHPNIARLFDGGATPNGQPYLVLEYIKGLSIDAYCQSKGLNFIQILELILPICDAVAIAHQRLIIHCDIKPSNIVVSQAGRPSLLDFGIANLVGEAEILPPHLDEDAAEVMPTSKANEAPAQGAHFTQTTVRGHVSVAYTPRYASPEQIANKPITTATDIYSLGRVIEDLCALDPAFAGTSAVQKNRLQLQELHAIIDKACAEIPSVRYGSAQILASDISNLLRGARVDAAAFVPGYQSRKWFSQHWLKAAAGLLFLTVISGFSVKVFIEKNRAEQQANNAEIERKKAEAQRAIAQTERAVAQAERQTAIEAKSVAETARQASLLANKETLAQRDVAEGARKKAFSAEKLALAAKAAAEQSMQQAQDERDNVVKAQKSTETVNNFLVSIFDGVNPSKGGSRNASARDVIARAEQQLATLKDVEPVIQARLFRSLAAIHLNLGDRKQSAQYNLRAADAYATYGDKYIALRSNVISAASVQLEGENNALALTLAQQAVQLTSKDKVASPLAYVVSANSLIVALHRQGRYREAAQLIVELDAIYAGNAEKLAKSTAYASFRHNAAYNLYHLGNYVGAEKAFAAEMKIREQRNPVDEHGLAATAGGLANTFKQLNKNTEAEALFLKIIARMENKLGEGNSTRVEVIRNYATFLKEIKRFDDAHQQFIKAETVATKYRATGGALANIAEQRATLAEARGQHDEAVTQLNRAVKMYAAEQGEVNRDSARGLMRIAQVQLEAKATPVAREFAERSIAMQVQLRGEAGEADELMLRVLKTTADIDLAEYKPAQAIKTLERIATLDQQVSLRAQYNTRMALARAWAANNTGSGLTQSQHNSKAAEFAQEALTLAEKSRGKSSATYIAAQALLDSVTGVSKDAGSAAASTTAQAREPVLE